MAAHTKKSTGILRVGHSITGPNQHHCPQCNSLNIYPLMDAPAKKGDIHLSMSHYCGECEASFEFHYEFMPPTPPMTFGQLERKRHQRAPVYTEGLSRHALCNIARTIRNHVHNDRTCEGKRPILRDMCDEVVAQLDLCSGWEGQNGIVRTLIDLLDRYARDSEGNPYHWHTIYDALMQRARVLEATGP